MGKRYPTGVPAPRLATALRARRTALGATAAARVLLLAWASAMSAAALAAESPPREPGPTNHEPYATGWAFYTDNDYLSAGLSDDQGYTGGFALSLSGKRATRYPWSLSPALGWIDRVTGWSSLFADVPYAARHSWQIGTMAFTPKNTDSAAPVPTGRPYAGLVFVGNTRQIRLHRRQVSYMSNLTLGLLGTPIPESIQNGLHAISGNSKARGWDHEISDGGEPTFRWQVQRRQTHWSRRNAAAFDFELNSVASASIGYSTQASIGLTGRWGEFSTPWWSFNPAYSEYINLGAPAGSRGASELYLWGGAHLRRQFYNAFFEGQLRESEVTFDRPQELRSVVWELNLGATWSLANGYHVTLAVRERENELRQDHGQRSAWGSLIIGRQF